jgi:mycothiol synthase
MDEPDLAVVSAADPAMVDEVFALAGRVAAATGVDPLSEDRRRGLRVAVDRRSDQGFWAVLARGGAHGDLVGYVQVDDVGHRSGSAVEVVVLPAADSPEGGPGLADRLLDSAVDAYRASGGGKLRLWVGHATGQDDRRAGRHGFVVERDLLQLRCTLPLPDPDDGSPSRPIATRPFLVGRDEPAWLVANNRAFAGHPEQGQWDLATIGARELEAWFDPDGFLVLEADGRLAGSCWTKVHAAARPPMGEIYVIGVDPDFHGRGWGRALTRAGLDHLASLGLTTGMLYVDAANTAAMGLYRSMGFTVHHVDRSYVADIGAPGGS